MAAGGPIYNRRMSATTRPHGTLYLCRLHLPPVQLYRLPSGLLGGCRRLMQLTANWLPSTAPAHRLLRLALRFRNGGTGAGWASQRRGGWQPLLKVNSFAVVSNQQFPVGLFQHIQPEACIAGPFSPRQQLQAPSLS